MADSKSPDHTKLDLERRVSAKQAAQILGVSEDTVRRHYRRFFKRVGPHLLRARLGDLLED
jgi:hypothetical protein